MLNRSIAKMSFMAIAFLFLCSLSAYAQDCTKMTSEEMVSAIYAKIETKYAGQTSHINVTVTDGVVKLQGWVTEKKVRKEIEKFAKKTACVKKVDNQLTIGIGGGCGPGQKTCGDICIPTTETCNIRTKGN
jgi:hypothetical protein